MFMRVIALAALALFAVSPLLASEESDRLAAIEKRLQQLEKENKELKNQIHTREKTIQGQVDGVYYRAMGAATPSVAYLGFDRPDVAGTNLTFNGEFLYWKVQSGQNTYALYNQDFAANTSTMGDPRQAELDWDTGFRIGMIYELPYDGWDLGVTYTYYRSDARDSVASTTQDTDNDEIQVVNWDGFNSGSENALTAESRLRFRYDVVNMELARNSKVSDTLSLRVFGGPSVVWFNSNRRDQFFGDDFSTNDGVAYGGRQHFHTDAFLYGVRAGVDGTLKLKHGISLKGKVAASLLTGEMENRTLQIEDFNNDGVIDADEVNINISQSLHRVVAAVEAEAGVQWQHKVLESLNLRLFAGYQFTNYFNALSRYHGTDDFERGYVTEPEGNLGLHGLVIRVGLDF